MQKIYLVTIILYYWLIFKFTIISSLITHLGHSSEGLALELPVDLGVCTALGYLLGLFPRNLLSVFRARWRWHSHGQKAIGVQVLGLTLPILEDDVRSTSRRNGGRASRPPSRWWKVWCRSPLLTRGWTLCTSTWLATSFIIIRTMHRPSCGSNCLTAGPTCKRRHGVSAISVKVNCQEPPSAIDSSEISRKLL